MFLFLIFVLSISNSFGQDNARIRAIKQLFYNYNKTTPIPEIEIKEETGGGGLNWIEIYGESDGTRLIKIGSGQEFGSESADCYFQNDTIAFIFYKTYSLMGHWSQDTVRFHKAEFRLYFEKGEVIKTLKKQFVGIEGIDDKFDLNALKNVEIDYKKDYEINWRYLHGKVKNLIPLKNIIRKTL